MDERRHELLASLDGDVIDIGAGTGANLPHYVRARRVVAVEPDERRRKRLCKRRGEANAPVEVVAASAENLPFADGIFDAAVAAFVLCSVEDQGVVLAEIRRVLRPGGALAVLEHVRGGARLGRWQDRLTPVTRRISGNCRLNRETLAAIEAAGFDVSGVRSTEIPGTPRFLRPGIHGRAIKTSP